MKLHATLICKRRLAELGWETRLVHQDEQNEQTHWSLGSNIPYRSYTWPRYRGGVFLEWDYGVEYKEWKLNFNRVNDLRQFLKRYYRHYINFWIWEDLEYAIAYENIHIYKALHSPQPRRFGHFK